MKAWKIILGIIIIFSFAIKCKSQSVSVGYAVPLWGATESSMSVSVGYKGFEAYYIKILKPQVTFDRGKRHTMHNGWGLSYAPFTILKTIRPGVIMFTRNWPSSTDKKLNFYLDIGYTFSKLNLRFSYTHISNAYRGKTNPGMDLIRIKYLIN